MYKLGRLVTSLVEHQHVWWLSGDLKEKKHAVGLLSLHPSTELWHERLKHISLQRMQRTSEIVLEPLTMGKTLNYCNNCSRTKQPRIEVTKCSKNEPTEPLERANLDTVDAEYTSRCGKKDFVLWTESITQCRRVH